MTGQCKDCMYWGDREGQTYDSFEDKEWCCRHAPSPMTGLFPGGEGRPDWDIDDCLCATLFPMTDRNDRCGEFEKAIE